jgi:hypothetical protein
MCLIKLAMSIILILTPRRPHMSQEKNFSPNNVNFAKFVQNHTDKHNNNEQILSNVNSEFATENDAQFIDNNNVKNDAQQ